MNCFLYDITSENNVQVEVEEMNMFTYKFGSQTQMHTYKMGTINKWFMIKTEPSECYGFH